MYSCLNSLIQFLTLSWSIFYFYDMKSLWYLSRLEYWLRNLWNFWSIYTLMTKSNQATIRPFASNSGQILHFTKIEALKRMNVILHLHQAKCSRSAFYLYLCMFFHVLPITYTRTVSHGSNICLKQFSSSKNNVWTPM